MTTASLRFRRRLPRSPLPAPLEDDDLFSEILLRLPPRPSSLPRASAVCRRWRRLLSDPAFRRRFRINHRRSPPLLGCFIESYRGFTFHTALDAPDCLPRDYFFELNYYHRPLGCRHGLALFFMPIRFQISVLDPVARNQRYLAVPSEFKLAAVKKQVSGAVLRAAGEVDHFQVVLVSTDVNQPSRVLASVYSSETGVLGDLISAPLPSEGLCFTGEPAVLAGDCLYWSVAVVGSSRSTLEFDLDRHSLAVKLLPVVPVDMYTQGSLEFMVIRAEGGGMGFVFSYGFTAQLWTKETNCDGVALWEPGRIIELDKLLRLNSKKEPPQMIGYAEENNVVFFRTVVGVFMVHLESLKVKKLKREASINFRYYPFETVYTPGISGGNERVEVVRHSWWTRWRQYIRQLFC